MNPCFNNNNLNCTNDINNNADVQIQTNNKTKVKNSIFKFTSEALNLLKTPNLLINSNKSSVCNTLSTQDYYYNNFKNNNIIQKSNKNNSYSSKKKLASDYLYESKSNNKSNSSSKIKRKKYNNIERLGNLNIGINIKNQVINNSSCNKNSCIIESNQISLYNKILSEKSKQLTNLQNKLKETYLKIESLTNIVDYFYEIANNDNSKKEEFMSNNKTTIFSSIDLNEVKSLLTTSREYIKKNKCNNTSISYNNIDSSKIIFDNQNIDINEFANNNFYSKYSKNNDNNNSNNKAVSSISDTNRDSQSNNSSVFVIKNNTNQNISKHQSNVSNNDLDSNKKNNLDKNEISVNTTKIIKYKRNIVTNINKFNNNSLSNNNYYINPSPSKLNLSSASSKYIYSLNNNNNKMNNNNSTSIIINNNSLDHSKNSRANKYKRNKFNLKRKVVIKESINHCLSSEGKNKQNLNDDLLFHTISNFCNKGNSYTDSKRNTSDIQNEKSNKYKNNLNEYYNNCYSLNNSICNSKRNYNPDANKVNCKLSKIVSLYSNENRLYLNSKYKEKEIPLSANKNYKHGSKINNNNLNSKNTNNKDSLLKHLYLNSKVIRDKINNQTKYKNNFSSNKISFLCMKCKQQNNITNIYESGHINFIQTNNNTLSSKSRSLSKAKISNKNNNELNTFCNGVISNDKLKLELNKLKERTSKILRYYRELNSNKK